jgi:hypothetical protein
MQKRAGRWAYSEARRVRRAFVKENARLLASVTAALLAVATALVAFEWWAVGKDLALFLAGGFAVGIPWGIWTILEFDGSRQKRLGGLGEEWTSEVFRRSPGWHVIDHVEFDGYDVDHVAAGPGGVLAVETKVTSIPWKVTATGLQGPYADPVAQARRNARKIRLLLKSYGIEVPVVAALALWGRGAPKLDDGVRVIDGVAVLSGKQESEWREGLRHEHLDAALVNAIKESIEHYIDRHEETMVGRS